MDFITPTNADDVDFLTLVRRVVVGSIQQSHPADIFVVRIDHWFDHKWLAFAGKLNGVLPYRPARLTVPPFVPDRVLSEDVFTLDAGGATYHQNRALTLHRYQRSGQNLSRRICHISESAIFVWFSGNTAHSEHGSMMVYVIQGESQQAWYASFLRGQDWRLHKVEGLSKTELSFMTEREVNKTVTR
jgi:hypothetical protein